MKKISISRANCKNTFAVRRKQSLTVFRVAPPPSKEASESFCVTEGPKRGPGTAR